MRKIYNFLLIILIIAAIVVGTLIAIKYGRNHINEKEINATIEELESKLQESEEVEQSYKGYKVVGIIEIPNINIKYPILETTTDETMKISVTKFWGPEINEIGNVSIAGHNNRDGTMFGKTKFLNIGDTIKLTNLKNETIEYEIFNMYTVDPNDVSYVESVEGDKREVTLITCTKGHQERLITKAREK